MDVSRAIIVSPYAGTQVPAERRLDPPPPAPDANAASVPAATLPRVAITPPVKRVFDGDLIQAERERRLVSGAEERPGRLFDARRRGPEGPLLLREERPRGRLAEYEGNTAERLLARPARGSVVNEEV